VAAPLVDGLTTHFAEIWSDQHDPSLLNNLRSDDAQMVLPASRTLSISRFSPYTFVNWLSTAADTRLESSTTLLPGDWPAVTTGVFNNSVLNTFIVNDPSLTNAFFRLTIP
jgi:hypothetical protein